MFLGCRPVPIERAALACFRRWWSTLISQWPNLDLSSLMDAAERIRQSFAKQGLMTTLGATLGDIAPGSVEISLIPNPAITQQHGFVHAGAVSAIADTAAGYAAMSLVREASVF
jgi:hypothetical protein